jgi:hypothetical protein
MPAFEGRAETGMVQNPRVAPKQKTINLTTAALIGGVRFKKKRDQISWEVTDAIIDHEAGDADWEARGIKIGVSLVARANSQLQKARQMMTSKLVFLMLIVDASLPNHHLMASNFHKSFQIMDSGSQG